MIFSFQSLRVLTWYHWTKMYYMAPTIHWSVCQLGYHNHLQNGNSNQKTKINCWISRNFCRKIFFLTNKRRRFYTLWMQDYRKVGSTSVCPIVLVWLWTFQLPSMFMVRSCATFECALAWKSYYLASLWYLPHPEFIYLFKVNNRNVAKSVQS